MSFYTTIAAVVVALALAPAAFAEGHEQQSLFSFSIGGFTSGDINGAGTQTTVFSAGKDAWNNTQIGTDTIGEGCGIDCLDTIAQGAVEVGEMAFLDSSTASDIADKAAGSSMNMNLAALTELEVTGTTLRDMTALNMTGNVAGYAVGDTVSILTNRHSTGKVQNNMDYTGPLCEGDPCGSVTQGTWAMGSLVQNAHVTAAGQEAISISNTTSGALQALIEQYKGQTTTSPAAVSN